MKASCSMLGYCFYFLAVATASLALAQDVYKSVGPDGNIIYSDHPAPEARLEKTLHIKNAPSSPLSAETLAYIEKLRKGNSADTPQPSGVTLYSATWCGYCRKAKAYLASKGVDYRDVDIDNEDGKRAYAKAGGGGGIPLLLANGHRIQGFSEGAYDKIFAK